MSIDKTWDLYSQLIKDYNQKFNYDGINGERLARRLHELSVIGLTKDGGSMRYGFSAEETKAKSLVKQWMKDAGLKVKEDGAGNIYGLLVGKDSKLPTILSGSHLDSVPNGGHFDGPLGVLSSLEVVESWKETGYQPERDYEVVIFTDEEGSRFNSGMTGSLAAVGDIDLENQLKLVDENGQSFSEVLESAGLSVDLFSKSARNMQNVLCFIEVHIEQGKILENKNLPTGIVSGIAGPSWLKVEFTGVAGHAGNTRMTDRKDALVAASEFVYSIHRLPEQINSTSVATVGKLNVFPNGINVIPGRVSLSVDIRDIHKNTRDKLVELIINKAQEISTQHGVEVTHHQTLKINPVPIPQHLQAKLAESLNENDIAPTYIPSGAGHDAMTLGNHVPIAMLFVKSKDGISHSPNEWSSLNNCIQTIHVLKNFIEKMDTE